MKPNPETLRASLPGYPPVAVHRFHIATEPNSGADLATCGPYAERSLKSCAARKLARTMVAAGEPDGPLEAYGPTGRLNYRVPSLRAFSKRTLSEEPRLHLSAHKEHPFAGRRNGVSGGSGDSPATLVAGEAVGGQEAA